MNKLEELNSRVRAILRRLRIPCARSVSLRYQFTVEPPVNPGITVVFPDNETTVVAPGDGKVLVAQMMQPGWVYTPSSLHTTGGSFQIVIDHGGGVKSVTHGMRTCDVFVGQQIQRGQSLGQRTDTEVFFAVLYLDHPYDPVGINRHFKTQNGSIILGQGGKFRFAPDFTVRDLSDGIMSTLVNGFRYFVPLTCAKPDLLINIAFNGDGSKVGPAVAGFEDDDYWNVYTPVAFQPTAIYGYCAGFSFNLNPVVRLLDFDQVESPIWFERQLLVSDSGVTAWFDTMLSRWTGGYVLGVPLRNIFSLRSVPPGDYVLYLYANEGTPPDTSTFYFSINGGGPSLKANDPTVTAAFVNDANYVQYSFTLAAASTLHITAYGFIAGLQLQRV